MANVANVFTENSSKNQSNFEVITLSSDEEQSVQSNEDVSFLFKRFILACRPHVSHEAIKSARLLFAEVQGKLTASHDLVDKLERYIKEVKKENAGLYLSLICRTLNKEKSVNNSVISNSASENLNDVNKVRKCVTFSDVSEAGGFEPTANQNNNSTTCSPEIASISDDDDFVRPKLSKRPTKKSENMPSTSSAYEDGTANKTKGKISTRTLTAKQRKKLAARLKQRLKEISNEIKILNRAELTLDEMDMCDSTYIQENRLKKKFEKTWTKLCKILGRPPNTGRVTEKPIRASSTGYSLVDKAVAKFLKERPGSFPDYFDIRDVVMKTNKKYDLRMSPQVLNGLIADIFTDIGNKLQRRRERDLVFNFGSHLLDDFKTENDPALSNQDLALQLEQNRRISKRNLKHVYTKYAHLERYEIGEKTRKSGRVKEDTSSESETSDDEQDYQKSRNHNRYARQEVKGKSKKGTPSMLGLSREGDGDSSSESGTSDDEQDPSRTILDDSMITIDDSDVPTSQESTLDNVPPKISTDMSSASHVGQSLPDTDHMEVLSDSERPVSPVFPLTLPIVKQNETGSPEQTLSTVDPGCSNSNTQTNQQTFSSSGDCEIINKLNEHEQLVMAANESLTQLGEPVNEPSGSNKQPNTDDDCKIINDPKEELVTMKQLDEPINEQSAQFDEPVDEPSIFDEQPNTDDDCKIVNDPKEELATVKQLDKPINEQSAQLDEPINEPSVFDKQPNTDDDDDDCTIVNDPKEQSIVMEQLDEPFNEPSGQLDEPVNEPSVFDNQPDTDDDCTIVNDPKEQSVVMEQPDEPINEPSAQLGEPVNEPSVFNNQPNTNDDFTLVNDPKKESVVMEQPDQTGCEPSVDETQEDDCLIIDDDQEDLPSTSCSEPLKIATSTPSDELIKTLNVLREVFRTKLNPRDKSTESRDESTESRDKSTESRDKFTESRDKSTESKDKSSRAEPTESKNSNSFSETVPNTVCSSKDSAINGHSNTASQTDMSKALSGQGSNDNTDDLNGNSDLECVTVVSDSDVIMFDNDQCSTSTSVVDSVGIETSDSIPRTCTTSNSPPQHTQSVSTKASINVDFSTKPITSNPSHSPSSPKPSTSEISDAVNPRKRKASRELAVQIPKQSVKCLEYIAWSLKKKRIKLPDAWLNSKETEKNSDVSPSRPTTSTAVESNVPVVTKSTTSSTVSSTLSENNSQLVNTKAKIDLQHRYVFRERTLNALKGPTKPCNVNANGGVQSDDITSSVSDDADKRDVIIIDD